MKRLTVKPATWMAFATADGKWVYYRNDTKPESIWKVPADDMTDPAL